MRKSATGPALTLHSHQTMAGGSPKRYHIRQENLLFVGSSHEFVGAEQGNTNVSVFLYHGKPGSGPAPASL